MEMKNRIGERIKALRKERDLKQEQLAWQSNVDRTYLNHIETGKRNISVASLEKIVVDGLKMTLSEFFDDKLFNEERD